jgi:hypothetical protein
MGFYFRRRLSLGPLRLNLSKSGIGISSGIRGLRAGITAHGRMYTTANVPGTGLYWRKVYARHAPSPPSRSHHVGFWLGFILVPIAVVILIAIATH